MKQGSAIPQGRLLPSLLEACPQACTLHPGIGSGHQLDVWAPGSGKSLTLPYERNSLQGLKPTGPPCAFPGPGSGSGLQPRAAVCGVWFLPPGEGKLWGRGCAAHPPGRPVSPGHLQSSPRPPSAPRYKLCLCASGRCRKGGPREGASQSRKL